MTFAECLVAKSKKDSGTIMELLQSMKKTQCVGLEAIPVERTESRVQVISSRVVVIERGKDEQGQ